MHDKTQGYLTFFVIDWSTALFIGNKMSRGPHGHHFIQLAFALGGSFKMKTGKGRRSVKALILDAGVPHQFQGASGDLLVILVIQESRLGRRIKSSLLAEDSYHIPNLTSFQPVLDEAASSPPRRLNEARAVLDGIVSALEDFPGEAPPLDDRVARALETIDRSPEKKIEVRELARVACLSESRLQHLFKSEIGIPIRRYLLWKRLQDGLRRVLSETDFTAASLEAGFADSAHMSKTFKSMFGCTLSDIFKDSRFIQAVFR